MITERRPPREWIQISTARMPSHPLASHLSAWQLGPVCVISSLERAEAPDGSGDLIQQWQISISSRGKRPKKHHVRRALRAFRMTEAEEDNHHPGVARHFFLPVDPERRVDCQCKTDEVTVTDPDGYRWQNSAGDDCRGCEFERTLGKPCPLHSQGAST